jgi:hypothetical protein
MAVEDMAVEDMAVEDVARLFSPCLAVRPPPLLLCDIVRGALRRPT